MSHVHYIVVGDSHARRMVEHNTKDAKQGLNLAHCGVGGATVAEGGRAYPCLWGEILDKYRQWGSPEAPVILQLGSNDVRNEVRRLRVALGYGEEGEAITKLSQFPRPKSNGGKMFDKRLEDFMLQVEKVVVPDCMKKQVTAGVPNNGMKFFFFGMFNERDPHNGFEPKPLQELLSGRKPTAEEMKEMLESSYNQLFKAYNQCLEDKVRKWNLYLYNHDGSQYYYVEPPMMTPNDFECSRANEWDNIHMGGGGYQKLWDAQAILFQREKSRND